MSIKGHSDFFPQSLKILRSVKNSKYLKDLVSWQLICSIQMWFGVIVWVCEMPRNHNP